MLGSQREVLCLLGEVSVLIGEDGVLLDMSVMFELVEIVNGVGKGVCGL